VRLVLDTTTAISGPLWGGTPGRLIEAAKAGHVELVSSAASLLVELQGVLNRAKFAQQLALRGVTVGDVFDGYAAVVRVVVPAAIAPTVARDPADDQALATAIAGQADLIVSGDSHLLDLKQFMGIDVVTAASAAQRVQRRAPSQGR